MQEDSAVPEFTPPRAKISKATRKVLKERDGGYCRKCGTRRDTQAHHIGSRGDSSPENLITLCRGCHTEWHVVESAFPYLEFDKWLDVPTAVMLVRIWMQHDAQLDDMKVKDWRDGILVSIELAKKMNRLDDGSTDDE